MFLNKKILFSTTAPCLIIPNIFLIGPKRSEYRIIVNYNGQADLLLSLQIPPDYYPYQFKRTQLYDYLTDIDQYILSNDKNQKDSFKSSMKKRMEELLGKVKEFGPSLWNEDLYDTGLVYRNNQFWNTKKSSLLLIEQFIADDYTNINQSYDLLPIHKDLIITNYRAAQDPYTIFSKKIFKEFKKLSKNSSSSKESNGNGNDSKLTKGLQEYLLKYNLSSINSLYRFAKYIEYWNEKVEKNRRKLKKYDFFKYIKENFKNNKKKKEQQNKHHNKYLFTSHGDENDSEKRSSILPTRDLKKLDKAISLLYKYNLFEESEIKKLKEWVTDWDLAYLKEEKESSRKKRDTSYDSLSLAHHPALEQSTIPGSAPLAEGSQKNVIIFLYLFGVELDNYANSKEKNSSFESDFNNDYRKEFLKSALKNAVLMAKNYSERLKNIREYFKKIGVVDSQFNPESGNFTTTNSKSLAIVTFPPEKFSGGNASIQTISKFPFIYEDLGIKQVFPSKLDSENLEEKSNNEFSPSEKDKSLFSVDDNGWWWNIGDSLLNPENLLQFKNTADMILMLANPDDWNLLKSQDKYKLKVFESIIKNHSNFNLDISKINTPGYKIRYQKYHLWNEGLRSPIALNLLLDNLVDMFQQAYDQNWTGKDNEQSSRQKRNVQKNENDTKELYKKASEWGSYWTNCFIKSKNATENKSSKTKRNKRESETKTSSTEVKCENGEEEKPK